MSYQEKLHDPTSKQISTMEGSDADAAATATTTLPVDPILDLDDSTVQGQIASAVMDLKGNMVRGKMQDAPLLFEMLVEAGALSLTSFRRLTVCFPETRYVVSRDPTHVYIVQTSTSG